MGGHKTPREQAYIFVLTGRDALKMRPMKVRMRPENETDFIINSATAKYRIKVC
jgi:hypothetical protein